MIFFGIAAAIDPRGAVIDTLFNGKASGGKGGGAKQARLDDWHPSFSLVRHR